MLVIRTSSSDPWRNLAAEEYLLGRLDRDPLILFLWQSRHAVVIGRNQNPWMECDLGALARDRGKLARRLSGGGAVYHDLGNLNFSFIMRRERYRIERQWQVLLGGLAALGIEGEYDGHHSLIADGRKISGSAFCLRRDSVIHHGTVLVSADMDRMSRYLSGPRPVMRTHAVRSVPSMVVNLSELSAGVTIEEAANSLVSSAASVFGSSAVLAGDDCFDAADLPSLEEKYSSWEWRFGRTPAFGFTIDEAFGWGRVKIELAVRDGLVTEAAIESEDLMPELRQRIAAGWTGCPFRSAELAERVLRVPPGESSDHLCGIAECLRERRF